ncbi:stearoyl-CoA 9-desaturase [Chlorobiota bacterium]|nr:stearoyl-CoA 9-desaturase [Chlorobiota bacterium]
MSDRFQQQLQTSLYFLMLIVIPTLGTLTALYLAFLGQITWLDIILCISMVILTELGITMGFHRMLVHQSFIAHPIVKFILLMLGSMALQGPASNWASVHLKHHAHTDDDDDPHSPTVKGWLHSHCGWIFTMAHDEHISARQTFGKKFQQDKMVQFFDATFFVWSMIGLFIPFLIGGLNGLLWGGFVRLFLALNFTWSVNSFCHIIGGRMFNTPDKSKNNLIVGILAMGEGWHNNHHAFPRSAFHGMAWWQIDISGYIIRLLEILHLVKNVYRVPNAVMQEKLISEK